MRTTNGTLAIVVGVAMVAGAVVVSADPEVCASTFDDRIEAAAPAMPTDLPISDGTSVALTMIAAYTTRADSIRTGVVRARVLTVFAAHAVVVWSADWPSRAPSESYRANHQLAGVS